MTEYNVEQLDGLIQPYLKPNQRIIRKDVVKLPQAGFGSVMLKLGLIVREDQGSEEEVHVVAKILPNTEMARTIFNVQVTFKNEVAFYDTILPTLDQFRKDNGLSGILDSFPKFYGARCNLDEGSSVVSDDAVLLMENLFEAGFKNINRLEGFTLQGAEFVLKDLAKFHGTTIALRLKQSWLFEKKVKATCKEFIFPEGDDFNVPLKLILEADPESAPYSSNVGRFVKMPAPPAREPFAGVTHNDLWVNNTMQKLENGKIVANKFVDFQAYHYRSCVADVFFFILTSVQLDILMDNFEHLFKFYHQELLNVLQEFRIDLKPFSYKKFMEEVKLEADYEFSHALQFICLIKMPHIPEKMEDAPQPEELFKIAPANLKDHLCFVTSECAKRGWIK